MLLFSARTPQASQNLVEPWWNPGGTLVEPSPQGRPEPPRSLSGLRPQSFQLLGNNIKLSSGDIPNSMRCSFSVLTPRKPRRTWWNPGGTLVEPSWRPRGTLPQGRPEPPRSLSGLRPQSFQLLGDNIKISSGDIPNSMRCSCSVLALPRKPRRTSWNLASGPPRTTPEPIWTETPKLSAVGE